MRITGKAAHRPPVTRRDFGRRLLRAGAGLALLRGQESIPGAKVPLALVKGVERKAALRTAIESLGGLACQGKDVYLKADFNCATGFPASTHPETLSEVVRIIREAGGTRVILVERSGMGSTREIWGKLGILELAEKLEIILRPLDELPAGEWRHQELPGSHWKRGVEVPRFITPDAMVIQICNLKTHRFGGHYSASLKNSIGLVAKYAQQGARHNYMEELHGSDAQRQMIAEVNQIFAPSLVVMDGMKAFVEGGPETGDLAAPEAVAVCRDRVAVDAVGIALLRLEGAGSPLADVPVFEQDQVKRAVELKLGIQSADEIQFLTPGSGSGRLALQVKTLLSESVEEKS